MVVGASLRNIGVQSVIDAVVDYLPSPADLPPIRAIPVKNTDEFVEVEMKETAPPLALAFKIQHTKEMGAPHIYPGLFGGHQEGDDFLQHQQEKAGED